jgi:hypothetical protein
MKAISSIVTTYIHDPATATTVRAAYIPATSPGFNGPVGAINVLCPDGERRLALFYDHPRQQGAIVVIGGQPVYGSTTEVSLALIGQGEDIDIEFRPFE